MERKTRNGKREYQTFARLQMQIDYSVDEMAEAIETVLNLIEKQQAEIEDCKKCILRDEVHNYIEELEKKDKIIDLMATDIYGMQIECNRYFKDTEEVKQCFNQKIEKGE